MIRCWDEMPGWDTVGEDEESEMKGSVLYGEENINRSLCLQHTCYLFDVCE